jgi:two-component system cell cycle response regulator
VLTDWTMPEMDGVELCKALRSTREGRTIYVLLLTGRGEYQRIVEAFDAGADDYVNKPFNAEVLLARVRAGQRMIELREQVEADRRDRARQLARMAVLNRKLKTAAMTDILTRLPNRRYAMGRLDQEVATALRSSQPLCAILIDIDHFKSVNDRYGHDVGDRVLQETAEVLKGSIRRGDIAARLGGEEFLVICPGSDMAGAIQVAQRIRDAVSQHPFVDLAGNLTVSLGVAELSGGCTTVDTLLKHADRRVYLAKARGRDQVCADEGDGRDRARAG